MSHLVPRGFEPKGEKEKKKTLFVMVGNLEMEAEQGGEQNS
jgi:hypothetical protein